MSPIEAAGGLLWRPAVGGAGVEVALVHRPKYDDWSVPKGKLATGEHVLLGALREVEEETGFRGVVGRPLGQIRYLKDSAPKRVRYWTMRVVDGEFLPSAEVDQLMWLPPREGQLHLAPDRDRTVLAEFLRDTEPTWPVVVVRHGSAGERSGWPGPDRERPLDALGHQQAADLADLLAAFGVERVLSADVLRCLDTVGPFAERHRVTVESEPLLSETGYAANPEAALERMLDICATGQPTAVCSQGKTIPDLLARLCLALGRDAPDDTTVRKGGLWALHLAADRKPRVAGLERFPPPS